MDHMPCILSYCAIGKVERFLTEYGIESVDYDNSNIIRTPEIHSILVQVQTLSQLKLSSNFNSARALLKKNTGTWNYIAESCFFGNDTWTSPQTNSEEAPKIPLVHFF